MFVALVIQHAKRMRRIIQSSVASPALPFFFHIISQTARYSGGKINTKRVFWFSLKSFYASFLILRRTERGWIKNAYWSPNKLYIMSDFKYIWTFSINFLEIHTEIFPWFFLGCKANARVKLAKTGHGPHSSKIVVLLYVLFVSYRSMYCLCVNVYCHRVTTQLQLTNISYHININFTVQWE